MGDARASDDRLPWLDAVPARASTPAAPRTRAPLMLLLALFLAAGIAVMAFLAGRTTAPREAGPVPIALPAPVAAPAPVAPPPVIAATVESAAIQAAPIQAARPTVKRANPARRPAVRRAVRRDRRGMIPPIKRAFPQVRPATVRRTPASRPVAGGTAGVVQLGAYVTAPLLDASWGRLVGAYPALATLPRAVTVTAPSPGRPRFYRLRLLTPSRREAHALCDRLHAVGRGCMVVASAK
jgi:hypothetical protein